MTQGTTYKPDYKYLPPIWPGLLPFYDFLCFIIGLGPGFREKVLNNVSLRDGMIVADIGCGTGVLLSIGKEKYPNVEFIGLDPDEQALDIARRRLEKAGLAVALKEAYAESLPLSDKSVDVCFSTFVFHHLPDNIKRAAAAEIYRALKSGGQLVLADFGATESKLFRKMLFFEKLEYIEGNFNGLIPKLLLESGFKIKVVKRHFPGVDIILAEK